MVRSNESAVQRLQVGLVGLLSVLIFVSVASMILSRTDNASQSASAQSGTKAANQEGSKTSSSDDPLVELGVTPVVPEQQDKQAPAQQAPQN